MIRLSGVLVLCFILSRLTFGVEPIDISSNKPPQVEALRVIREVNAFSDDDRVIAMVLNVDLSDPAKVEYWNRVNSLMIERYRTKIVGLSFLIDVEDLGDVEAQAMLEWATVYSAVINAFNIGKFGNDWGSSTFLEVARDSIESNEDAEVSPSEDLGQTTNTEGEINDESVDMPKSKSDNELPKSDARESGDMPKSKSDNDLPKPDEP